MSVVSRDNERRKPQENFKSPLPIPFAAPPLKLRAGKQSRQLRRLLVMLNSIALEETSAFIMNTTGKRSFVYCYLVYADSAHHNLKKKKKEILQKNYSV